MTIANGYMQVPADPSLADELAREELVEMANLTSAQTGITGTIFISTAMGAHGRGSNTFCSRANTAELLGVDCRHADRRRQ